VARAIEFGEKIDPQCFEPVDNCSATQSMPAYPNTPRCSRRRDKPPHDVSGRHRSAQTEKWNVIRE